MCESRNFLFALSPRSHDPIYSHPSPFDSIVSEMYTRDDPQAIAYSNKLNMLLVSRVLISSNYYDYRYPV